jgi:hypothetical protein
MFNNKEDAECIPRRIFTEDENPTIDYYTTNNGYYLPHMSTKILTNKNITEVFNQLQNIYSKEVTNKWTLNNLGNQ